MEVVIALTLLLTWPAQPKAAPLVGLRAATWARVAPPTAVKSPPTYTRVPAGETLRARTTPLALGFRQEVAGGGVAGGQPVAGRPVDRGEVAAEVDGAAKVGDGVDPPVIWQVPSSGLALTIAPAGPDRATEMATAVATARNRAASGSSRERTVTGEALALVGGHAARSLLIQHGRRQSVPQDIQQLRGDGHVAVLAGSDAHLRLVPAVVVVGPAGGQQVSAPARPARDRRRPSSCWECQTSIPSTPASRASPTTRSRSPSASRPGWASTATPPALAAMATASVSDTLGAGT